MTGLHRFRFSSRARVAIPFFAILSFVVPAVLAGSSWRQEAAATPPVTLQLVRLTPDYSTYTFGEMGVISGSKSGQRLADIQDAQPGLKSTKVAVSIKNNSNTLLLVDVGSLPAILGIRTVFHDAADRQWEWDRFDLILGHPDGPSRRIAIAPRSTAFFDVYLHGQRLAHAEADVDDYPPRFRYSLVPGTGILVATVADNKIQNAKVVPVELEGVVPVIIH